MHRHIVLLILQYVKMAHTEVLVICIQVNKFINESIKILSLNVKRHMLKILTPI